MAVKGSKNLYKFYNSFNQCAKGRIPDAYREERFAANAAGRFFIPQKQPEAFLQKIDIGKYVIFNILRWRFSTICTAFFLLTGFFVFAIL
ncbi:MAG: hypothetical protein IJ945_04345 [Oscillospiraceae bacterium]|nr:hypothetical protein [Oscillospiraceae bacterium]